MFRHFLALVALFAASACTPDSNPPQTTTAAARRMATLPPDVERLVGPTYDSPQLQALVERVGNRLVAQSSIPGTFRFYVLDQPQANAHAVSSGYVFVTRGLLALIDDDAELAAAGRTHDALRDGLRQADRIADREHHVADARLVRLTEGDGGQFRQDDQRLLDGPLHD